MDYFLIYGTEYGVRIKKFADSFSIIEYIKEYYQDCKVIFLNDIPKDVEDFFDYKETRMIIVKGKVVVPKPVQIVKSYEIE